MNNGILSGQPGSYGDGSLGLQPGSYGDGSLGALMSPGSMMFPSIRRLSAQQAADQARIAAIARARGTHEADQARMAAIARARGTHGIGALPSWATPLNIGLGLAAAVGGYLLFGMLRKK
jgi:hypothetical protein